MHARLRLDIGFAALARAASASLTAFERAERARRVEARFSPAGDAVAALSARSGFDSYLSALALPAGSQVLVSGLTIPHMVQILEAHGLEPVPFALDPRTLAPAAGELERRAGARVRAVLFAHLFGQRAELSELLAEKRRRGWLLWEDCAQAYTGDAWRGEGEADVALFSFGLIKTATAIQGGILRVPDEAVRTRMRAVQARWPVQSRRDYLRRVLKAGVLRSLQPSWVFTRFAQACARRGRDLDEVLHAATRGFPGADFLTRLRYQPCAPLLEVLDQRLAAPARSEAAEKRAFGEALLAAAPLELHGRLARERHHWVLALGCDEPAQLVSRLRAAGFDATARSSLVPVAARDGSAPRASHELLERLVYVPLALSASAAERAELARLLRETVPLALTPPAPSTVSPSAVSPSAVRIGELAARAEREAERAPQE
jgi:dTDP-4-amino-4,6-dideoxygalactose transaminase